MRNKLDSYKNKRVVVRANGLLYRGVLKEISEESIQLKGMTGWIEIPLEGVTSVSLEGEKQSLNDRKFVDKSYFELPPEEDESK